MGTNESVVSVRLPKGVVRAIDRAVAKGEAENRSELVRAALGIYLTIPRVEAERGVRRMEKILRNPALPIIQDAFTRVIEELGPGKIKKLFDVSIKTFAPAIAGQLGIPARDVEREMQKALAAEPNLPSVGAKGKRKPRRR